MQPLRYVILRHDDVVEPHFDLMFETLPGSMLATWRSALWPIVYPLEITRLRDHRRLFLEYEGEISGGRGSVTRVTDGDCEVEIGEGGVWTIRLTSGAAPTTLVLRQVDGERWLVEPR